MVKFASSETVDTALYEETKAQAENVLSAVAQNFDACRESIEALQAALDETRALLFDGLEAQNATQKTQAANVRAIEGLTESCRTLDALKAQIAASEAKANAAAAFQGDMNMHLVETSRRIAALERRHDVVADPNYLYDKGHRAAQFLAAHNFQPRRTACVICPLYPGGARAYGGEFIQARVEEYIRQGVATHVFEFDEKGGDKPLQERKVNGVSVFTGGPQRLAEFLASRKALYIRYCVHFISETLYDVLLENVEKSKLAIWLHGFEARDYKRLLFNFDEAELRRNGLLLEKINNQRMTLLRRLLPDSGVRKIFVSSFIRRIAEADSQVICQNSRIIHNVINEAVFPFREKADALRKNILWVRSFSAHNYANDLSRDTILELSKRPVFKHLNFTIFGDGRFFEPCTSPLRGFDNVKIEQRFLNQKEIADLHKTHGIMLVPSRFDTQGVTLGEAMSSGLACVTNRVAAIPEFADPSCVCLENPEDPVAMANAIERLYHDPVRFQMMSRAATERATQQCGIQATIYRELAEVILR